VFGSPDVFIIEGINSLPEGERRKAWEIVERMEVEAAETAFIHPEAIELFDWMDARGLKRGIITRNCRASIDVIVRRIGHDLGVIIAREDAEPKPAPNGVLLALDRLGVEPEDTFMVGDFAFDIEAGKTAGCRTIFLRTRKFSKLEVNADFEVRSLLEIPGIIEAVEGG
jgi:HAD superfamily hydrolase (TIGR01549 family)